MLYQTLSGNTSNVGLAIAQGGTASIKPSIVPQMVQGSIVTLVPDTVSIDANGAFSFSIARTARVRLVITDSSGRICADVPLQITDDAAANLSTYMETVPPEVLRNTFINAANAAASEAAALASKIAADADAVATAADRVQTGLDRVATGEDRAAVAADTQVIQTNLSAINTVSTNITPVQTVAANNTNINTVADISPAVTTVAGINAAVSAVGANAANINTVAAISSAVTTVSSINAAVSAVAANSTNINAATANSTNINTVAGISANVTTVAGISADVSEVVANSTNINAVVANSANINTVAEVSPDVTTVSGINAAVSAVAANSTNINAVTANSANINTVAGISANVTTVAGVSASVTAVAADSTNIDTAAANIAAINTTAASISSVNTNAANIAAIQGAAANAATATSQAGIATTQAGLAAASEATITATVFDLATNLIDTQAMVVPLIAFVPAADDFVTGPFSAVVANGIALFDGTGGNMVKDSGVLLTDLVAITGNQSVAGVKTFTDTTDATSKDTGAVVLKGGLGVDKAIFAGDSISATTYISGPKAQMNPTGGYMVKLTNKTGGVSVKGTVVTVYAATAIDNAVAKIIVDVPTPIGVMYEDGIADGADTWIVVAGIAEVYFIGSTTRGNLARGFVTGDAGYVSGQALAEAVPTTPFATDKHFYEIGHVLASRTGAGLAKTILHFN